MRLQEVEKGESVSYRILFHIISAISGMRLPDAARVVMYHKCFYGKPMATWTHAAMRGQSSWSVGERELMAAMVAEWNSCPFCIDAHGSIAALELGSSFVNATLKDTHQIDIPTKLQATLTFLKKLVQAPDKISTDDLQMVLKEKVSNEELEDAIAVAALFCITVRCANALDFALLDSKDSIRAAKRMLKRGYSRKKINVLGHTEHAAMAGKLCKSVLYGPGMTTTALRQAISERATGGAPIEMPYDELALRIGNSSYKITDEQVRAVVTKSGSEKAAFEIITAAAVGTGIYRWNKGLSILKGIRMLHR